MTASFKLPSFFLAAVLMNPVSVKANDPIDANLRMHDPDKVQLTSKTKVESGKTAVPFLTESAVMQTTSNMNNCNPVSCPMSSFRGAAIKGACTVTPSVRPVYKTRIVTKEQSLGSCKGDGWQAFKALARQQDNKVVSIRDKSITLRVPDPEYRRTAPSVADIMHDLSKLRATPNVTEKPSEKMLNLDTNKSVTPKEPAPRTIRHAKFTCV